ncbi:MAG: class I tRNA ligase family protein, partial [Thermoplasmata archaeon]
PSIPEIIFVAPETELTDPERALRAGSGVPAERAARAVGARSIADRAALDEATERLYRLERLRGRMLVPALGPISVEEARTRMAESFEAAGTGFPLLEFSEAVICRNGHAVVIRRVPDQWFLKYSDPAWKAETHALLGRITVQPPEYRRELPEVIDWFEDRPCTRRGRWLGTPFPLDPSWTIEPIADSTFYPAYYILRRFVGAGRIAPSALTDALFDFVFRGEGTGEPSLPRELQQEMRAEFEYWYPLDLNIGGKEHKRVHFPVFLFTHAKLLPPELQPRGLFVHWWLVSEAGEKLSKKQMGTKGGEVPPVRDAFGRWGADGLRLFYGTAASPSQDIEWDATLVDRATDRLEEIGRLVRSALAEGPGGPPELDAWLGDALHALLDRLVAHLEAGEIREAAEIVYSTVPARLRRYLARGGAAGPALRRAAEAWIRALSPLTPHLAEELGAGIFGGLVATEPFPEPSLFEPNAQARAREEYLDGVEEDLRGVLRPAQGRGERPGSVTFYVASGWKRTVEGWMRESTRRDSELVREVMARTAEHPELASARAEVAAYVQRVGPKIRNEPTPTEPIPEEAVLRAAAGYLARRFGFGEVRIHSDGSGADEDPMGRRHRARPGRPAFYLTSAVERTPRSG